MTLVLQRKSDSVLGRAIWLAKYIATLLVLGVSYFALAKAGLSLASIHPSASPVWPCTGVALGCVLVGGLRLWPAILLGAFAANVTNNITDPTSVDVLLTSAAIAIGNTLEAVIGGYLIRRWSDGWRTFETTIGVAKFALIALAPGAMISATVGVGSLSFAGQADWENVAPIWLTWWLGDVASALVVAPVVVLWLTARFRSFRWTQLLESLLVLVGACVVGAAAFSPLLEQTTQRTSLAFLAVLPLIWAALRRGPRDTATVVLILTGFAVWGTFAGGGPFEAPTLNDAFLLLLVFVISIAIPSLALSADVAMRKRVEGTLRQRELDLRAIFSQAVVGIAQVDTTGRFKLVNDRFCEIVQRAAGDLKA
ncbi:MAG: MASE1 domain-containing protein, partial [Xanthobacteraceae bacterium]